MRIKDLCKQIRNEATVKKVFKGNENEQLPKRQLPEEKGRKAKREGYGERHCCGERFLRKDMGSPQIGQRMLEGVSTSFDWEEIDC